MLLYPILILCMVLHSNALSCLPCEEVTCPDLSCAGSEVLGVCGCCNVCAKQLGEGCGGLWNMSGTCEPGLECVVEADEDTPSYIAEQMAGTCQ